MNLTSIKLSINGAHAWATVSGPLTSGMVGIPVTIEYDDAWDGLRKNLMCRCSPWGSNNGEIRSILDVGETATVAHEIMQPDMFLYLGIEGFNHDGTLVIPTTWARCGKIEYGANTCEDPSTNPELSVWNQLQVEMEQTKAYVLTPEQAVNIQSFAQTATQAAQEARQSAEDAKQAVESGLYYMPIVSQPTDTTLKFEFKPSLTGAPIPKPVTVELPGRSDSSMDFNLGFVGGRLYILVSGVPVGNGVEINGTVTPSEGVVVFAADFSGDSPNPAQFYAWEGRVYAGAKFDALENIQCADGAAILTTKYDAINGRWLEQMMTTGGLFESDDFICKFRAKFSGLPGAWNYFITYGTGTHWTDGVYSDGIKWPAGGEIDAFEQAATYSETPTGIGHSAHWGSGSNSGYPDTHEFLPDSEAGSTSIATDEWHDFKFRLKNGVATMWIDGEQIHEFDLSEKSVSNNYLVDYHPFLRPHAFYMAAQCHAADSRTDTANVFTMEISDLEVYQDSLVECAGLEIYPQMWSKGTELVFPVGAELYLERNYTPANTSNKACRWESSNPEVATVVQGYVKVVGIGTAVITATCGEATAQYTVTAADVANVPCVKVGTKGEVAAMVGDTVDVAEQIYRYPGFTTDEIVLASDSSLVSIDGSNITMLGAGSAEIAVTVGNCTAKLMLNIASGAPELMTTHDFIVDGVTNNGPSTCDVTFVADGTYTIHYRIAENPEYDGNATADMASRMVNASNLNRLPLILTKPDDTAEVTMGNASPVYAYAPSDGDWITLLFTAASGYSGQVYVNGSLVKDQIRIFPDYVYIGEPMRPNNGFRNANTRVKYCVDRIEVYRGDNHELHRAV